MGMRLSRSIVGEAEAEAVKKIIMEDGYLGMGAETRKFEENIAKYLGAPRESVVSVNSGTAALHLAAQAAREGARLDPAAGQPEILVPTLTFVASFQAVSAAGCRPVACDVLLDTGTLDLEDAARRVTPRTIAVMHVDYASNPWQIDKVYEFAAQRNLRVIDDAAHAFGCRSRGRKIGSFGDLVCFSFDGIKNITCGEGGCAIAFNEEDSRAMADARLLGVEGDSAKRFAGARSWNPDVKSQGWRYHLSNVMAAIGNAQLRRLEREFIPARRALYDLYSRELRGVPHLELLKTDPEDYIVPHIMPVRILDGRRERLLAAFDAQGIPHGTHYKPNHLLSFFASDGPGFPNAERLYAELVTLPLHPGLSAEDARLVCDTLKKAME